MTLINKIFEETLKKITPTQREISLVNKITSKLKDLLDKKAKALNITYTVIEPQGSTGIKQTQLRDDFDVDLFVGLDYNEYRPKYHGLSKNKLRKVTKKLFLDLCNNWIIKSLSLREFNNPRLLYAEHPYVTVDYIIDNIIIKIDIVLYFELDLEIIKKSGPVTAVDRSPWHGRFVRDELTKAQKNDVRILKQFFKSCHCYGDKSAVGKIGFIGYSAELLIYYLGNILNVFEHFNELKKKPFDFYSRSVKELKKITHFKGDCLIIIDPIDKNRNVASAISDKAYKYCNQKVFEFLQTPNTNFFKLKPIPEKNLANKEDPILSNLYIIELKNENSKIHYTINRDKLYSLGESIKDNGEKEFSHAERFGKIIFEVYFEDVRNEYNIALYCEKPDISKTYIRKGPPITEHFHATNFKKKNSEWFEEKNYLWVKTEREFDNFLKFLTKFSNSKIPDNFKVLNISNISNVKTTSGKKSLTVLTEMVLPFITKKWEVQ